MQTIVQRAIRKEQKKYFHLNVTVNNVVLEGQRKIIFKFTVSVAKWFRTLLVNLLTVQDTGCVAGFSYWGMHCALFRFICEFSMGYCLKSDGTVSRGMVLSRELWYYLECLEWNDTVSEVMALPRGWWYCHHDIEESLESKGSIASRVK